MTTTDQVLQCFVSRHVETLLYRNINLAINVTPCLLTKVRYYVNPAARTKTLQIVYQMFLRRSHFDLCAALHCKKYKAIVVK